MRPLHLGLPSRARTCPCAVRASTQGSSTHRCGPTAATIRRWGLGVGGAHRAAAGRRTAPSKEAPARARTSQAAACRHCSRSPETGSRRSSFGRQPPRPTAAVKQHQTSARRAPTSTTPLRASRAASCGPTLGPSTRPLGAPSVSTARRSWSSTSRRSITSSRAIAPPSRTSTRPCRAARASRACRGVLSTRHCCRTCHAGPTTARLRRQRPTGGDATRSRLQMPRTSGT